MSWKASAYVKELVDNLTVSEKMVLLILADYYHDQKESIWPNQERLARECLMTDRNLRRVLVSLEKNKFVTRSKNGTKSTYSIIGIPDKLSGMTSAPETSEIPKMSAAVNSENPSTGHSWYAYRTSRAVLPDTQGIAIRKNGFNGVNDIPSAPSSQYTTDIQEIESLVEVTTTSLPKKKESKADPRFTQFVEVLSNFYKAKSWEFAFNGRDGKQLSNLLRDRNAWTVATFEKALKNYFKSDGVNPEDMPYAYLSNLPRYKRNPLNRFKQVDSTQVVMASAEEIYARSKR